MRLKHFVLTAAVMAVFSFQAYAGKISDTINSDEVVEIAKTHNQFFGPGRDSSYHAWVNLYGDFGGGTVTMLVSTDGGTTKNAIKYYSAGSYVDMTATDDTNFNFGWGWDPDDQAIFYASMSGSTSPSVSVDTFDNR